MALSSSFLLLLLVSLSVFSLSYSQTEQCPAGIVVNGNYTNTPGTYHIRWTINCDASTFSAIIEARTLGWVAFGLNSQASMIGAYVIQLSAGTTVSHRVGHNTEYSAPAAVSNDIYTLINGSQNSTHTIVGFTRPLSVSGADAPLFSILPAGNIMVWAFSDSDTFSNYHDTNRGTLSVNFFRGSTSSLTPMPGGSTRNHRLVHGALMLLAFGFLAPAGTFVARYLKGIGHPWYIIHMGIQYTLLALMIAAFIIIENDLGGDRDRHFQNPHQIIGLTIVILTFIQVFVGILANALFKPNREGAPFFPDKLHWWLGRLVILYAIANIFIGFDEYGYSGNHNAPHIAFAVWVGLVALLFLAAEIITGQTHHVDETDDKFRQYRTPILIYGSMFVLGIILYAVTLHYMYNWN